MLVHFDLFRLFCREFTHFLVYFVQAELLWPCTKMDKYEV